jgi:hypothetical protein
VGGPTGELQRQPGVLKIGPPGVTSNVPAPIARVAAGQETRLTLTFATSNDPVFGCVSGTRMWPAAQGRKVALGMAPAVDFPAARAAMSDAESISSFTPSR